MQRTLADIALAVGGKVIGDGALVITGISGIKEAQSGDLTFLANSKYLPLASSTQASAIMVEKDVVIEGKSTIQVDNPSLAFATVVGMIKESSMPQVKGVHPSAVIADDAVIEEGVGIGPCAVIEPGVRIGKESVICAGAYIGTKTVIGSNCLVYPNVTIREDVQMGNNVIIHSGTVVGSDGYGYAQVDGKHVKIPQTGKVVIEDDVELGANVTIDRARFDKTVIGKGTKIDNLVQIAHNVQLGENCLLIAQCGVAGSTVLGKNVILAGQVGVAGHLVLGDQVVVTAQTGVTKSISAGMVSGTPAEDHRTAMKIAAYTNRLPDYVKQLKELRDKVAALEERANVS